MVAQSSDDDNGYRNCCAGRVQVRFHATDNRDDVDDGDENEDGDGDGDGAGGGLIRDDEYLQVVPQPPRRVASPMKK